MIDVDKLHTNDLPSDLDRAFYNDLVQNFIIIKNALLDANAKLDQLKEQHDTSNKEKSDAQLISDTSTIINNQSPSITDINNSDAKF